jgi:excisionase family DNA binding protein
MAEPLTLTLPAELVEQLAAQVADLVAARLSAAQPAASPWMNFQQACSYLGFSKDKLYRLCAARAIAVRKKENGQGLLFHRDELDDWLRHSYPRLDRHG